MSKTVNIKEIEKCLRAVFLVEFVGIGDNKVKLKTSQEIDSLNSMIEIAVETSLQNGQSVLHTGVFDLVGESHVSEDELYSWGARVFDRQIKKHFLMLVDEDENG